MQLLAATLSGPSVAAVGVWALPALLLHRPSQADGCEVKRVTDSFEQQRNISLTEVLRKRLLMVEVRTASGELDCETTAVRRLLWLSVGRDLSRRMLWRAFAV